MQIRTFEPKDRESVVKLWHECNLIVPWNDPYKDIQRKLQVGPDLFIVGEIAGDVVATVMGGYEGHRGWINYLAVAPAHQRKGYGRRLVAFVESRIKQKGCPKINLQVRQANTDVIRFYEAIGYKNDNLISLGKRLESDD